MFRDCIYCQQNIIWIQYKTQFWFFILFIALLAIFLVYTLDLNWTSNGCIPHTCHKRSVQKKLFISCREKLGQKYFPWTKNYKWKVCTSVNVDYIFQTTLLQSVNTSECFSFWCKVLSHKMSPLNLNFDSERLTFLFLTFYTLWNSMCNLDYGPRLPRPLYPRYQMWCRRWWWKLVQTYENNMQTYAALISMKKYVKLWEQNANLCSYDDDENEARLLFFGASWFNIDPTPKDLNLN